MMTFQEALNGGKTETFSVYKTDDDKRLVFGWASVAVTVDGEQLEDRQHDIIDPEELERAAYEYVLNFGDTGEEHDPALRKKGKLVESCVFTREKQRAMGLPEGILPEGWWIGFRIEDDDAWQKVKDGTYRMFSIEGTAERTPVEKAAQEATGCGVLVLRDGKVLTGTRIERAGRGRLCGPGGHIEDGETPEEAAAREAEEEFGIVCRELEPLGVQDGGGRYGTSAVYLCTDYDGEPRTDEREMTEPRWLDPAEIRAHENVFPPFRQSLELLPVGKAMTFSEVLLKGNPYHDPADGKFTFAPGGARARHHHTPPTIPGGTLRSGGPGHHGGGSAPKAKEPRRPLHKEDVTAEYINGAKPGSGSFTIEPGYSVGKRHSNEIDVARMLHDKFGGDIVLLTEVNTQGVKTPDYSWRGKLWDLKDPTSAKAADDRLRSGAKQIRPNPGGIILDFKDNPFDMDDLNQIIDDRARRTRIASFDVMVISNGNVVSVFRYKK